ncbi:unnamed protein product [Aphis gossypii]|uniref:CCHC-type domain-containing protein n=1 Tax=Aphis gossypii TaxID=80765 RepID=A0A9P0J0W5_APHGO|nr:unnamed protein product [Aphis gossypii]
MRSATTAETWKKLQGRIQGVNETTYSYFHEKIRLCRELKLDETETKQQICVGLRSQTLCMVLMSSAHIREEELLAEIRRMEEVQLDCQLHFKNNSTITKKTAPTTSNVTQVAAIKEGTQKITNDWTREVRCYNCQQTGHISRDCDAPRKPLKCVICHQEGHTKKNCKTVTQTVVSLVNTNLNKSGYIKMVKINNNPVLIQGLVDTGCDVCLIKASAAKQLNLCVLPTTKQLTVYGNNPINVVNDVTSVTVEVDDVAEMVELWVVEDLAQSYDLLIGRTFTDRENVTFIKTKNEVIFGYDYIFKFDDEVFCKMKSARVKVNSDQLLKANEVTIVTASVNEEPVEVLNFSVSHTLVQDFFNSVTPLFMHCLDIMPIPMMEL